MLRLHCALIVSLLAPGLLVAQAPLSPDTVVRLGPGVTAPRLLHRTEPEYTRAALDARVQGTVVLQIIVDEQGRATGITILNPVGFGLDERAVATVSTWRFTPAMKDGHPVRILATVEVNFRLNGISFDQAAENRRAKFNQSLRVVDRDKADSTAVQRAVKSMQDLAHQKYPPAMFAIGIWEINGEHITKDFQDGLRLVRASAAKDYAPAMCEVAVRLIEGRDLPQDPEKG
jgi:TonB family protein